MARLGITKYKVGTAGRFVNPRAQRKATGSFLLQRAAVTPSDATHFGGKTGKIICITLFHLFVRLHTPTSHIFLLSRLCNWNVITLFINILIMLLLYIDKSF
jgi:hypothetical protein